MKNTSTKKINRFFIFAASLLLAFHINAQTSVISTVAGNGYGVGTTPSGGYSGDGSAATSAELFGPVGMAVDASGNIYFADTYNNRVRMVSAATGIITTIAGNGYGAGPLPNGGYTGDGSAADSAELFAPAGVAVDAQGNVYIADYGNAAIRKVDAITHKISTVAGGTEGYAGDGGSALMASLDEPDAVALDAAGNIYIADWGNNVIRKVTKATGIITTVVGDGEGAGFGGGSGNYTGDGGLATLGSLNGPVGLAIDHANNIYISDASNNVIRKVDGTTNILSTFAGDSAAFGSGYSGDGGPAVNAYFNGLGAIATDAAGNLYIPDEANNVIRKVNVTTNVITTIVGNNTQGFLGDGGPALSAELFGPSSVAIDASGNLYFTDTGNERVRKVSYSATGVNNINADAEFVIYPNPAKDQVAINLSGTGYTSLKITNALGQDVYNQALNNTVANEVLHINTNNMAAGLYFMELMNETGLATKQLVIQK